MTSHPVERVRCVGPLRCDYVRCAGLSTASALGFIKPIGEKNRWWRPGWWAHEGVTQHGQVIVTADAEKGNRVWPQSWADRSMHLTRVDLCIDIEGWSFTTESRTLFTCRGTRKVHERKYVARTIDIGSRESPINLRIYLKSAHCDEADRQLWTKNGWRGGDVWRIEYELHRKALDAHEPISIPEDNEKLWNDCLARIRMCEVPPRTYTQQNKAKTHPLWHRVGSPARHSRKRGKRPQPSGELVGQTESAMQRLIVKAGAHMLVVLLRKLLREARLSNVDIQSTLEEHLVKEAKTSKAPRT